MPFHIEHHDDVVSKLATRVARDPAKAQKIISEVRSMLLKDTWNQRDLFRRLDALEAAFERPLTLSELSVNSPVDLPEDLDYNGEPNVHSGHLVEQEFWYALTKTVEEVNRQIVPVGAIWMPTNRALHAMNFPSKEELHSTRGKYCRVCSALLGTGVRVIGHTAPTCPVNVFPWKTTSGHTCGPSKMLAYLLDLDLIHDRKVGRIEGPDIPYNGGAPV